MKPQDIHQFIKHENGRYFWLPRPRSMFKSDRLYKIWNTRFAGKETLNAIGPHGYHAIGIFGKRYQAHRFIWAFHHGEWPEGQIDHINHNRADNRIENLRVVSHAENQRNRPLQSNNLSGFAGVYYHKPNGKWRALIKHAGTSYALGIFDEISDAVKAREAAKLKFGFHPNHGVAA